MNNCSKLFLNITMWRHAGASGSCVMSKSSGLLSRGFLVGLSPRHLRLHVPGLRSVIFWTCLSRARPFSAWDAPRLPLLLSILQRCFRSTAGAAILYLSSRPNVGGTPSISPGSCLSVSYLTDPSLAGTPHSGASHRFSLVCLHRDPH